MSASTSGSAFSVIASEAEVCLRNRWSRPTRNCAISGIASSTMPVMAWNPRKNEGNKISRWNHCVTAAPRAETVITSRVESDAQSVLHTPPKNFFAKIAAIG